VKSGLAIVETVSVDGKGRVLIPGYVRRVLDILSGCPMELSLRVLEGEIVLRKGSNKEED